MNATKGMARQSRKYWFLLSNITESNERLELDVRPRVHVFTVAIIMELFITY